MSKEFTPISIDDFAAFPAEDFVWAEVQATSPSTGYGYQYRFHTHGTGRDDSPPRVRIDTEERAVFLQKGTEADAEEALVELAHQTRELTGGTFSLHPFYGVVYGTKTNPVAKGFLVDLPRLDEKLSLDIDLTDDGYAFDEESTREALAIGTTVVIPGPMSSRWFAYMDAHKSNPNQRSRDQAVSSGLEKRWDKEFKLFNGKKSRFWRRNSVVPAMELTPASAVRVIEGLGELSLLEAPLVTHLYTRQEAEALEASFREDGIS